MHDFHIELKNWLVDRLSALYINYESISAGVKGPLCGAEMVPTSVYTYATIFLFRLSHLEGCLSQYWLHPPRCGVCRWCQTWSHHLNLHRLVLRGHVINTLLFIHEEGTFLILTTILTIEFKFLEYIPWVLLLCNRVLDGSPISIQWIGFVIP